MLTLYAAPTCPFAQRTRALLQHLNVEFKFEAVDLEARGEEFLKLSPTGKVPLLVDGKGKLYESIVINTYLADRHGYVQAWSEDVYVRARQHLAMVQWDAVINRVFQRSMRKPDSFDGAARRSLGKELDELVDTVHAMGQTHGNLLSFHCAPFWARMDWLRELSAAVELVDERVHLRRWLDDALAQESIAATLPDREETVQRYRERYTSA
ncbi:MAG: glutathione S-transferase [Planctomycetota bacterium]